VTPFFARPGKPTTWSGADLSLDSPGHVPGIHVLSFIHAQMRGWPGKPGHEIT
jgi:hypothetical protein